ncbi:MAG: hypothetical protein KJZ78_11025 [Bryobacteraceae bacterium]|nr:hypothetical protein [Bryobacteraceae bacterium]
MAQRKAFLVRLDPATHDALQRWADAELRSVNAQIEFLLRRALRDAGRLPQPVEESQSGQAPEPRTEGP